MSNVDAEIAEYFSQFPAIGYSKAKLVLASGAQSHFLYYVETGAVKMSLTSAEGKNLVAHIFFPGSFFSLISLVNDGVNEYDFTTLIPTTLRKAPIQEVTTFLQSHPQLLYGVQLRLLKGLRGLVKRLEQVTLTSAYTQVADLLIYFATHFSESSKTESKELTIKISHQEIADWLGLSRENVSLQMKQLEKNHLITIHQHLIVIPDIATLKALV